MLDACIHGYMLPAVAFRGSRRASSLELSMDVTRTYVRSETQPLDDIEAQLEGHVCHVTRLAYLPSIIRVRRNTAQRQWGAPNDLRIVKERILPKQELRVSL